MGRFLNLLLWEGVRNWDREEGEMNGEREKLGSRLSCVPLTDPQSQGGTMILPSKLQKAVSTF